jgi:hypothetical protein
MLFNGDDNIYICALCKSYVHRIQGSNRICCERRGCIDLDMRVSSEYIDRYRFKACA